MNEENKLLVDIDTLQEWAENPRNITEKDFNRLLAQVEKLGQYKPLLTTKEGIVLGGNMRLKAYRHLGIEKVWVSVVEPKDKNEMLEFALSDNDRAGFYDPDMLANMLPNYEIDLSGYAVDLSQPMTLDQLNKEESEEKGTPPVEDVAVSKSGEIYQLGPHRLMCGDATKEEDVKALMAGAKADMIFTDPPYNVDYTGKTKDRLKIEGDSFHNGMDFYNFLYIALGLMYENSKAGAAIYVCHSDTERINFTTAFKEAGYKLAQVIIWVKDQFVMGRQDYQWQHEPILYGWKEGKAHYFAGGHTQTTIWNIARPTASREHPTMKPVALISKALQNNSKEEDIILDTFAGSGSTLIASNQTGRICYSMEIDPRYCDVIRKRYILETTDNADGWEEKTPKVEPLVE